MVAPTLPITAQSFNPLDERTNRPPETGTASCSDEQTFKPNLGPGRLPRKQSFRNLAYQLDSSDTLPSEPDSIYNAERLSSSDARSPLESSGILASSSPTPSLTSPPLAHFTADRDSESSVSHSRWKASQLEPIIERRSRSQLRRCNSVPRLQPSPERQSRVVKSQPSAHSIRPTEFVTGLASPSPSHTRDCIRSFSLDGLDCFPRSDTDYAFVRTRGALTSSSKEALESTLLCSLFPLKPPFPPPYRSPTPPGLPSFRTKEAQEYRLTPTFTPTGAHSLISRWLRRTHNKSNEHRPGSGTASALPVSHSPRDSVPSPSMAILRRMLGVSRVVENPPQHGNRPCSNLPLGVQRATGPGALVRADDGTMVRGRWGVRTSAHSVGQRALDTHPMARVTGLHSIDELVDEIDKACEMADEEHRHRTISGTGSVADTALEPQQPFAPRSRSNRGEEQANFTSEAFLPTSSYTLDPRQGEVQRQPIFESGDNVGLSVPTVASTQLVHTCQFQQIPTTLLPTTSTVCPDCLAGSLESARQSDQSHETQNPETEMRSKIYHKACWGEVWQLCCCVAAGKGVGRSAD